MRRRKHSRSPRKCTSQMQSQLLKPAVRRRAGVVPQLRVRWGRLFKRSGRRRRFRPHPHAYRILRSRAGLHIAQPAHGMPTLQRRGPHTVRRRPAIGHGGSVCTRRGRSLSGPSCPLAIRVLYRPLCRRLGINARCLLLRRCDPGQVLGERRQVQPLRQCRPRVGVRLMQHPTDLMLATQPLAPSQVVWKVGLCLRITQRRRGRTDHSGSATIPCARTPTSSKTTGRQSHPSSEWTATMRIAAWARVSECTRLQPRSPMRLMGKWAS